VIRRRSHLLASSAALSLAASLTLAPAHAQPVDRGEPLPLRGAQEYRAARNATPAADAPAPERPRLRRTEPLALPTLRETDAQVQPNATRAETRPALRGTTQLPVQEPVQQPVRRDPVSFADAPPDEIEPRPAEDDAAYSPLGLRVGSLTLFATLEQRGGYDTNPQRSSTAGRGDAFSRTTGELRVESDWSRHLFTMQLRGGYLAYRRERDENRPDFNGIANLHLDITRGTRLTFESALDIASERPGSPDLAAPVVGRPLIYDYYGSANITQYLNRTQFRLRGLAGRTQYEPGRLRGGGSLSQRDRDLTRFEGTLRTSYVLHPGMLPFVEFGLDRRLYDRRVGADGLRRSSQGVTGRVGTTFELTRTLVGEASIGYQSRRYDDRTLRRLEGLIGDAALEWSLSPVTTVNLSAASLLGETTVAGASGARTQLAALGIRHDLRRFLTLEAEAAFARTDYGGAGQRERSFTGTLGIAYSFNRALALTGEMRHERTWSSRPDSGYSANAYMVGLRLRK
jgi:hypothetical protein